MSKSYTAGNLYWLMPAPWVLTPQPSYCHSNESSSTARISWLNYGSSGTRFKPNWVMMVRIKSTLVLCVWGSRSYKNLTSGLRKSEPQNCKKAWKRLTEYSTFKGYLMCQKLSVVSWWVDTMMTLLQIILESIKLGSWLAGNTVGRVSEKTLKPMSRDVVSV